MRIGIAFSPTADWQGIVDGARLADELGLDAVGFWDHYHSEKPEWSYVGGWAAHAWLGAITSRVHLVPMVLANLNHVPGVLAKESAVLSLASGGRFELAIGAGDYPVEYRAWHQPYPDSATRLARLEETIEALRLLWKGDLVTYAGEHVQLTDAASTPAPAAPPRVVVGVGGSRRMIDSAVRYADELNVYADAEILRYARQRIAESGRHVGLSVYRHVDFGQWPADLVADLAPWRDAGAERVFLNLGYGEDKVARVRELAEAQRALGREPALSRD